ncbi:MAG: hypothetical protein ACOYM9_12960 [Bradymonadia bacterium]
MQAIIDKVQSLLEQQTRLLGQVAGIVEVGMTRRPPRMQVGGQVFRVDGPIRTFTSQLTMASGATTVKRTFKNGHPIVIHHVIGRCSDTEGLAAFRLSVRDENENQIYVDKNHAGNEGEIIDPLALAWTLTSANEMDNRQPLGLYVPKDTERTWYCTDAFGTPSYTIELTAFFQRLVPQK